MACDVWFEEPFASAHSLPMGFEVLDNIKVPKVMVCWASFALGGACLKGLQLVVDEMGWGNLPSASYEVEYGVEGYGSE